jgi:mono/diheme cytochrome c family protein
MPYPFYKEFSEEDLFSVIAYLRTLKPIRHDVPESSIRFPVNVFIRAVPSRYVPVGNSDTTNRVEYGKYLATIAACSMCHTPMEKGEPVKGQEFAGGSEFRVPRGVVRSANLTPDEETGIGLWTPDIFLAKFKQFDSEEGRTTDPATMGYQSVMPWTLYAGMTESDLAAIYAYLRTLPALTNNVIRFTPQK